MKLAISAIVKNEGPYLLEWIAWHKLLGISDFHICDNSSSDGSTELLQALQEAGEIKRIPFPSVGSISPQLPAYRRIMEDMDDDIDWVFFLDADEFLMAEQNVVLHDFLAMVPENVGAIAINWAIYGSSNRIEPGEGLVVERFNRRSKQTAEVNTHYKTVLRREAYAGTSGNPHHFQLLNNFSYHNTKLEDLRISAKRGIGMSENATWDGFRINHYVIKSWVEFNNKKAARGRATTTSRRGINFFVSHDLNHEHEELKPESVSLLKQEISRLGDFLPTSVLKGETSDYRRRAGTNGNIDSVEITGNHVQFRGWAINEQSLPFSKFCVVIGEKKLLVDNSEPYGRADVMRHFPKASLMSGFLIRVELDRNSKAADKPFYVYPVDDTGFFRNALKSLAKVVPQPKADVTPITRPTLTLPKPVMDFLKETYTKATTILEYGSGGSTVLAGELPGKTVFSVESDRDWVAMMQGWFNQEPPRGRVHLQHVDIGPTKEWGQPKDESRRLHWINYAMLVWERPDLIHPDVVLIDGRFRVACFLATLMNIRRPTVILFDDYSDRPHYHVVEELLAPARHVGRMAVFDAKPRALHPAELRRFASYFFRPD